MLCSNCGKDIPYSGSVCPYCKNNKSEDQSQHILMWLTVPLCCWLGFKVIGVIGFFIGIMIGAFIPGLLRMKGETPLITTDTSTYNRYAPPPAPATYAMLNVTSLEERLTRLKQLHTDRLITEEDFLFRKMEILREV